MLIMKSEDHLRHPKYACQQMRTSLALLSFDQRKFGRSIFQWDGWDLMFVPIHLCYYVIAKWDKDQHQFYFYFMSEESTIYWKVNKSGKSFVMASHSLWNPFERHDKNHLMINHQKHYEQLSTGKFFSQSSWRERIGNSLT